MLSEIETIAETNKVIKQVVEWLGPELVSNQEIPDHSTPKPWEGLTGKVWDHSKSEMVYVHTERHTAFYTPDIASQHRLLPRMQNLHFPNLIVFRTGSVPSSFQVHITRH